MSRPITMEWKSRHTQFEPPSENKAGHGKLKWNFLKVEVVIEAIVVIQMTAYLC